MYSAVRLWVAGGFVRVFRWAFEARNEGQSRWKIECICIALVSRRLVVAYKGRLANIISNGKVTMAFLFTIKLKRI